MKLNKIITISGMSLLGLMTSCLSDSEFLTEDPKGNYTIENAFEKSDQVLSTVLSAYYEYQKLFYCGDFGAQCAVCHLAHVQRVRPHRRAAVGPALRGGHHL